MSHNDKYVFAIDMNHKIQIFDLENKKREGKYDLNIIVSDMCCSADDKYLILTGFSK